MSPNVVALLYLAAGVLFILALRGLSSPVSSRRGNMLGMAGMTIAVLTTLGQIGDPDFDPDVGPDRRWAWPSAAASAPTSPAASR